MSTSSHFFSRIFDGDGRGQLNAQEVKNILMASAKECNIELSSDILDTLTVHMFEQADANEDGLISFGEFWGFLNKVPNAMKSLTINVKTLFQLDKKPAAAKAGPEKVASWFKFMLSRRTGRIWVAAFLFANMLLFLVGLRVLEHEHASALLVIAEGTGDALIFDLFFCMMFILRHVLAYLKLSTLSPFVPVDHFTEIHRMLGYFVLGMSVVHAALFLGEIEFERDYIREDNEDIVGPTMLNCTNVTTTESEANDTTEATDMNTEEICVNTTGLPDLDKVPEFWEFLFSLDGTRGWIIEGFAFPSGVGVFLALVVITLLSAKLFRQKKHFWVFYFGHAFMVPLLVLGFFHSLTFWVVMIFPTMIYVVEKVLPYCIGKTGTFKFRMKKVVGLPSQVTMLVMHRPEGFNYNPGDYAFVNIPQVSFFEWHPFAFSSSPFLQDEIWMHVRGTGPWTYALNDLVLTLPEGSCHIIKSGQRKKEVTKRRDSKGERILASFKKKCLDKKWNARVYIDGPYGRPGARFLECQHAVLIALGIGITPFASILQTVQWYFNMLSSHSLDSLAINEEVSKYNLRRVDFIWVNRTQHAFEWFVTLLSDMERPEGEGQTRVFNMRIYLTSATAMKDIKGFPLQAALLSMNTMGERDVITGLRTLLHAGRPNWTDVFDDINKKRQPDTSLGVFYSGHPDLGNIIEDMCFDRQWDFTRY